MSHDSEVISFDSYNLFLCFIITAGFQYTGFIIAYVAQFDKITDLWGASNFVILQLVLLFHYGTFSLRAVVVAAIVSIWGIRLSGYLFYRVLKMGHDERFDGARSFVPFFIFWTFQIAWVWIVSLPPVLIAGIEASLADNPNKENISVTWYEVGAWVVALFGVFLESTADLQKNAFKNNPDNRGRFCDAGVWSLSRHPNYLGDILLWWGMFVAGTPLYSVSPGAWGAIGSPLFITLLLMFASGLPTTEPKADQKYGSTSGYADYLDSTPILCLFPPALFRKCGPTSKSVFCCEWGFYRGNVKIGTQESDTSLTTEEEDSSRSHQGDALLNERKSTYSASYESIKSSS